MRNKKSLRIPGSLVSMDIPPVPDFSHQFEKNVSSFLDSCAKDTPLLIAVSGGADSMALLAALCAVKKDVVKKRLLCLHVEHGIRPADESCADADFVEAFCEKNGIECKVKHIAPGKAVSLAKRKGIGIEAAARFYRHRALRKEAKTLGDNTLILLAHTKDDLLETVLMRVLRGAGSGGLAAMPRRKGNLVRPILEMTRADVINYLKARQITWREDSTNADTRYLRNKIRHQLIPLLNDSFPSWKTGVDALAKTQSLTAEFLLKEAKEHIKWEAVKTSHEGTKEQGKKKEIHTDEKNFFIQPLILREEAVFYGIDILSSIRVLCALKTESFMPPCEHLSPAKSIKRKAVRQFCEGNSNAADLGFVKIKRENGKIFLLKAGKECFESGISRLIKG